MVEVMVALLLVVIGATGGLALLLTTMYATTFAANAQTASRLGQEIVDQVMTEPFDNIGGTGSACQSTPATVYSTPTPGGTTGNKVAYTRTCTATTLGNGIKAVQVNVAWTEPSGRVRTITMGVQRAQPTI